jgi:hypothetical protein
MTWIKLDDQAVDHPKIASLADRAFRWWVRGLSYASRFLTDGRLPAVFVKRIPPAVVGELVQHGLWEPIGEFQVVIHDYLNHQTPKSAIERHRANARDRLRKVRGKFRETSPKLSEKFQESPQKVSSTEYRVQKQSTAAAQDAAAVPPPPLIRGEYAPKTYGKIHGAHVIGFCDWCCLPEFVFDEFRRKCGQAASLPEGGEALVTAWALEVRAHWSGPIGDNLKFWRARWDEAHPTIPQHVHAGIGDPRDADAIRQAIEWAKLTPEDRAALLRDEDEKIRQP